MNISKNALKAEYTEAAKRWPFIREVERKYGLPAFFLFAVGSRETNLRNIIGDRGHGYGVWQRDNRSWPVDGTYLQNVRRQAEDAASLLRNDYQHLRDWRLAADAYNAGLGAVLHAINNGEDADSVTTGGDYGYDVMMRQRELWEMITDLGPYTLTRLLYQRRFRYQRGEDVRRVQMIVGAHPDAVYGPLTAAAVRGWQGHHLDAFGRHLAVDGKVGSKTASSFGWRYSA